MRILQIGSRGNKNRRIAQPDEIHWKSTYIPRCSPITILETLIVSRIHANRRRRVHKHLSSRSPRFTSSSRLTTPQIKGVPLPSSIACGLSLSNIKGISFSCQTKPLSKLLTLMPCFRAVNALPRHSSRTISAAPNARYSRSIHLSTSQGFYSVSTVLIHRSDASSFCKSFIYNSCIAITEN